jgi:hypothetical protein
LRLLTKARLLNPSVKAFAATNHVFDHQLLTMIPSPNSLSVSREAGRPINFSTDLRPPSAYASYPAWEPAAMAELFLAVSNTAAPPTFVPEWPTIHQLTVHLSIGV